LQNALVTPRELVSAANSRLARGQVQFDQLNGASSPFFSAAQQQHGRSRAGSRASGCNDSITLRAILSEAICESPGGKAVNEHVSDR
jgi:hypothetical protein